MAFNSAESPLRHVPILSFALPLIITLILCVAETGSADGPALDIGDPHGGSVFSQNTYSLGWKFRVESPIIVSALGIFDDNKDGMADDHPVGLFDASDCNTLRTITVKKTDPLIGFFRYRKLDSPIALVPAKDYYIAAVTLDDNYLLGPTTLTSDPGITFIGFSIFGNTEATTELKCPNGTQAPGLKGDFGPNFIVGPLPDELKNPDDPDNINDPNKRDTALTLFCNRNGVGLSNADCTATVADKGPPPRMLPTGVINFEARDGFTPASAQCNPTQVEFSPGIGSCKVQFAVPNGFTIGAKFPIDAEYPGDTNFNGSATSHKLIIPKCVGTPDKPCPNSIGLSFSSYPQLLKSKISMLASCGTTSTSAALASQDSLQRAGILGGSCSISGSIGLDAQKLFEALSFPEMSAIGAQLDAIAAEKDTLLYYLHQAYKNLDAQEWQTLQANKPALGKISEHILKNKNPFKDLDEDPFVTLPSKIAEAKKKNKKKKDKSLKSEQFKVEVSPDKTKTINIKFNSRLKNLFSVLENAGLESIPLDLTVTAKQKKRQGSATVSETIDVSLGE